MLGGAAMLGTMSALAQDGAPKTVAGFGQRAHTVLQIDDVFGIRSNTVSSDDSRGRSQTQTIDDKWLFPNLFGPRLGIHGIADNGVTYGALLGLWHLRPVGKGSDNADSITFFTIAPRLGYAGALQEKVGYWVRGGPSLIYARAKSDDAYYLDLSLEAYLVWTPTAHFGVTVGPEVDLGLAGHEGGSSGHAAKIGSFGLGAGMLTDF
ncbi:MAG: hypothetical protein NVS3B10_10580 [Polyangiales bacterium]